MTKRGTGTSATRLAKPNRTRMRRVIAATIACCWVTTLSAAPASSESLDLIRSSSGELVATLHTAGDAVVVFNYLKDGCYFSPDHSEPCFSFSAVNGTEPVPIHGCVANINAMLGIAGMAACRASDLRGVRLIAADGGSFTLYGGNGHHDDCSPLPVSIEMHGGAWHVAAWDGCTETISCPGDPGQVDADQSDNVNPHCDAAFVTRHSTQ